MKRTFFLALISLFVLHNSAWCPAQSGAPAQSPAQSYFTDVLLTNQNGEQMRFYTDLIKGKVVIINVFFATCHGVCPVMTQNLKSIQDMLGDRLGKDVHIISISVDAETDTPAALKEFAKKFGAKPGWYFITGKKENVDLALKKLGQQVKTKEDHTNIFFIGNEPTGLWKKAFGLAKPADLAQIVNSVLNDKQETAK